MDSAKDGIGWFSRKGWMRRGSGDDDDCPRYWLTPPDRYAEWHAPRWNFDFDPCPYPLPDGWDALTMEWGESNYANPPFALDDGPGLTAFVRKAIEQRDEAGKSFSFCRSRRCSICWLVPAPRLSRRVRWASSMSTLDSRQRSR